MCFSMAWLQQIFVWLVIVGAVVALIKLLIPYVLTAFDAAGGTIAAAINIVLWAVIAIAVIYIVFALIACIGGGSLMPPLPHGH